MKKISKSILLVVATLFSFSSWAGGVISAGPVTFEIDTLCYAKGIDPTFPVATSFVGVAKEKGVPNSPLTVLLLNRGMKVLQFLPAILNASVGVWSSGMWDLTLRQYRDGSEGNRDRGTLYIDVNGEGRLAPIDPLELEELLLFNCAAYADSQDWLEIAD